MATSNIDHLKIVSLEEHFVTPSLTEAWARLPEAERDPSPKINSADVERRLGDLGVERLRDMDESGVDVQVLSPSTPGVQDLDAGVAVPLARELNDLMAETIRRRPDRFQGFAALPTPDPQASVRELERAVGELGLQGALINGRTRDRNLDHPDFLPILEAAASLRVPLYLHPQTPRPTVREAYYSGFGEAADLGFAIAGIGWHYETGVQLLRLILSGAFDRFPDLQVITGHWGEVVLFYLERVAIMERVVKLPRPIPDYVRDHVSVTPSGIFSPRYLRWALEVQGVDRLMFSADYPYLMAPNGGARRFLMDADLSQEDRVKVAHGNWERMLAHRA